MSRGGQAVAGRHFLRDSYYCFISHGYFKQAYPTTFADLDGFVRRRLRSMLLKQTKRSHIGFGTLIHKT